MKLMCPKNICVRALLPLLVLILAFSAGISAQSKKGSSAKKPAVKKTEKQAKDAKKGRDKDNKSAKSKAKDTKRDKASAKDRSRDKARDNKRDKLTAKERARADKDKKEPASRAERKKADAERRRREEERRQAAIAEQRRREQAAREARARKLAFERGLRTETIANIAKDNTEGEDLAVRQAAINALGSHAGSVVVLEAQTGKVLTIVNQDWAVRSSIRPCSTIKLVTAAAGLNEGVINKEDGSVKNAATRRLLDDAIAYSDNGYFQKVGSNVGNSKFVEYEKQLGLGQPTGINLEGETPGRLPYSNNNARIYSHGDDTEVSTLQLAVMVSAITNGGNRVLPRVPRNTTERARFQTFYKARVELPQQNVRRMIPGMMGTAEYGTARRGVDASLGIAGKTGSCIDKGSWVGLFTSVAPIEQPKYAVAVITRGQSERGKYAAAVAGQVYRALSSHIVRTDRNLAQTEFHIQKKTSIDAKAAAVAEEEDDDAADASAGDNPSGSNGLTVQPGSGIMIVPNPAKQVPVEKPAPKKLITRTGDSKPVFPPVVITYDRSGREQKPNINPRP